MTTPDRESTLQMKTLSERLNESIALGYSENFRVKGAAMATEDGRLTYVPNDITISNFFRFEGYSSPEDNSILYLIETPDGKKGTLIDAYGAYSDAGFSNFIRQIENIHKLVMT